jgi:hypothetical protein
MANLPNSQNIYANGFPTLNQSMIDKLYTNKRTNELTANNSDIRDQIYNAGWKEKSDAVKVLNGAGVYGLVMAPEGMGGTAYKTTAGGYAKDEDFVNAAKAAGIDPTPYFRQQNVGMTGKQNVLDKSKLYSAINNQAKDLYSVTNAVEGAKRGAAAQHATVLYKADGSGNLVPVNNEQTGQPDVQYFKATRYAKDPGIMGCLAPFLMLAPAVGGILGAAGSAAAGAGTAAGAGATTGGLAGMGAGAGLSTGTMAGTMLSGTGSLLGNTANIAAGLGGTGALYGGTGSLPPSEWSSINEAAGAGTMPAGKIPADVAEFMATGKGLLSPDGLPYDPYAPGYQVGPEGPAKIGSQCLAFKSSPSLLDTAKKAKSLYDAGKSLFGGNQPTGGGGGGGGGLPQFLDSTAEFLNKNPVIAPVAGLKDVREDDLNVESLNSNNQSDQGSKNTQDDDQSSILGYAEAGSVKSEERTGKGALSDLRKVWQDSFCEDKLTPKFVRCETAEFLHSIKQSPTQGLKQIRQGLKVNPLATGGLPHKYAAAAPKGHKPEFITGMTGYYACGKGTGQSDDIAAMLHDGDYVMDAETVSALGDGSSKAGRDVLEGFRERIPHKKDGGSNPVPAKIADGEYVFPAAFVTALGGGDNKRGAEILDGLRTKLRAHKRGAPLDKIPPKAKDPIEYIKTRSK